MELCIKNIKIMKQFGEYLEPLSKAATQIAHKARSGNRRLQGCGTHSAIWID